jgi:hypothetical protein
MTKMQGMRRPPSGHLPPTGRPSTGHPHLPPATGRPSTGLRRAPSQGERDGGLASGRRGSWIAESKSAAPDEAAVRRILADPSAYARPSTAGSSMRAAGAQRLGDSGPTRGSQFRISALERADLECPRCQEQQKTIKTLRHKLLEYKNRCEAPMTTRLSSDLDAEVEGLRTERDALAVRANQLQAKLALLQGILDNQRVEEPNTQLEEEHRRLLLVVAELQKKMSDQQKEHAEEAKRLATQVDAAKAEAGQARTEAQEQRRVARETHENVLQGLAQSVAHAESLQDKLATCQVESAHSKVTSEARYALLLQNFRAAEVQATTAQRQLEVQTDHTRQAQEQASQLSERLREVDARSKELESRMAAADRQVQDMGETLEKTAKQVAVLVTGARCVQGVPTLICLSHVLCASLIAPCVRGLHDPRSAMAPAAPPGKRRCWLRGQEWPLLPEFIPVHRNAFLSTGMAGRPGVAFSCPQTTPVPAGGCRRRHGPASDQP